MSRPNPLAAVLLAVAALLMACATDGAAHRDAGRAPTADDHPVGTAGAGQMTAPLTGEPVGDPAVADRPVVAVKVENSPAGRPQSGLDAADVVFEELTEGGVTRFLALFQSRIPELVGPIRSARPEDAQLVPAYDAMLFISGARPDVLTSLRVADVPFLTEDGEVLWRDRSRTPPHNVFARGEELFAAAADDVPPASPTGWSYASEPPQGAVPCGEGCTQDPGLSVTVEMSHASVTGFEYDPDAGLYRRLQDGSPHVVTGDDRIGAANVVVLAVEIGHGGCCDASGNPLTQTRTLGTGRGVILRDGQRYPARWTKSRPDQHYRFTGPDDQPFPLKPGPTWLVLAPTAAVP
ncbi:MAG: DUF3048 domain-containing protein [Actinomycetota bacterium]|nr:DUF3048 domain-containing protein [Actinomycetota bacterium]